MSLGTDIVLHPHTFFKVKSLIQTVNNGFGTKNSQKLSFKCMQPLIASNRHENVVKLDFNSALNHKVVEDSVCAVSLSASLVQ